MQTSMSAEVIEFFDRGICEIACIKRKKLRAIGFFNYFLAVIIGSNDDIDFPFLNQMQSINRADVTASE